MSLYSINAEPLMINGTPYSVEYSTECDTSTSYADSVKISSYEGGSTCMDLFRTIGNLLGGDCITCPMIVDVIFDDPYTTVKWTDGSTTTVRCHDGNFSKEAGLAFAISRKYYSAINSINPRAIFKKEIKKATECHNHKQKPKTVEDVVSNFTPEQIKVVEALIRNAIAPKELKRNGLDIGDMPIDDLDEYLQPLMKKVKTHRSKEDNNA